jgi:hypothetical protein
MAANDIRREDVMAAIAEFDRVGQSDFLKNYGHSEAKRFRLVHNGRFYDSKAIVGVAHGYATGEFWSKEKFSGGTGPGAAVTILEDLGFYVDDATLFAVEKIHADLSHGRRAPYQYIVVLWAFAGARDGKPRTQPFSAVRDELAELLAPFAIGKTAPDPAMPWAALTAFENWWGPGRGLPMFWELDRRKYPIKEVTATESEVKRLDLVEGLSPRAYEMAQNTAGFMEHAVEVIQRFIGDELAFPWLLERLGFESPSLAGQAPEVADAVDAVEEAANPRRRFGRRLSAAENQAIEQQAVRVVRKHFKEVLGYETEDVGATESYDVRATKGDSVIKVEVKGTTSEGAEVMLTANEVKLHLAEHPNNALAVVRRIMLDRSGEEPAATGGVLELTMAWEVDRGRLEPIAYRYQTGL